MNKPQMESLEPRKLLTSALPVVDVTVSLESGVLNVRGDSTGADVRISAAWDRGVRVVRVLGGPGTRINGGDGARFSVERVRSLSVNLAGNADNVLVSGLRLRGADLRSTGDTITLEDTRLGSDGLTWTGQGAADNALVIRGIHVKGRTLLTGSGAGDDTVSAEGARFVRAFTFDGQGGQDVLFSAGTRFVAPKTLTGVTETTSVTRTFDFDRGRQGWTARFADYARSNGDLELDAGIRELPESVTGLLPAGVTRSGFFIGGSNRSDDLFMFLVRRFGPADGVVPGTRYRVSFEVAVASNAPSNAIGIGGAPGESVFLKAGASGFEPRVRTASDGHLRANIDHGAQSNSGAHSSVMGNIANGLELSEEVSEVPYRTLNFTHEHPTEVRANRSGSVWVNVGTDSGFEGRTELFYQSIKVTLTPMG